MGRGQVNFESNFEEGIETVVNLRDEIPASMDKAAEKIAKEFKKKGQSVLFKNENVVTGTGVNSFEIDKLAHANHGVRAANYLAILDVGRESGSFPDLTNPRFRAAAKAYGIPEQTLAASIAEKGTQPHRWIDETAKKISRNSTKRVKVSMNKAADESVI